MTIGGDRLGTQLTGPTIPGHLTGWVKSRTGYVCPACLPNTSHSRDHLRAFRGFTKIGNGEPGRFAGELSLWEDDLDRCFLRSLGVPHIVNIKVKVIKVMFIEDRVKVVGIVVSVLVFVAGVVEVIVLVFVMGAVGDGLDVGVLRRWQSCVLAWQPEGTAQHGFGRNSGRLHVLRPSRVFLGHSALLCLVFLWDLLF